MGLFEDVRASDDWRAAANSSLRVRDLIATGQVTQHTLDVETRSFSSDVEETQGCGEAPTFECRCGETIYDRDDLVARHIAKDHDNEPLVEPEDTFEAITGLVRGEPCNCGNVPLEGVHVYLCPAWERDIDGAGIDRRTVTTCDIEADEEAEQEAALRSYLRTLNMGTWLTSQPRRFLTTRIEWGA